MTPQVTVTPSMCNTAESYEQRTRRDRKNEGLYPLEN